MFTYALSIVCKIMVRFQEEALLALYVMSNGKDVNSNVLFNHYLQHMTNIMPQLHLKKTTLISFDNYFST